MSAKTLSLTNHKCQAIINRAPGIPIVFLHGYSYTSDVWPKTGITDILKEKQLPFLALDMPYGLRSRCKPKTRNTETNIAVIREATQSIFGAFPPILERGPGIHVRQPCLRLQARRLAADGRAPPGRVGRPLGRVRDGPVKGRRRPLPRRPRP